jgi:hypothetical protein
MGGMNTYSIASRVRRVTYEDAYIAVPVNDVIMRTTEDGKPRVDAKAMIAEGIRISQDGRVEWQIESTSTEPHPIQQAAPDGRKSFDPWPDENDFQATH